MSSPTPIHAKNVQVIENGTGITIVNGASPSLADLRVRAVPYLRILAAKCRRLPLRGLDSKANDPTAEGIHLDSVYVALDTKQTRPDKRSSLSARGDEPAEVVPGKTISALSAVMENNCVALLGDPGSGKTTFLSHLAYCLAEHHTAPERATLRLLPGWDAEDQQMPVLVVLRRFVAWVQSLPSQPEAGTKPVWDFLRAHHGNDSCSECVTALEQASDIIGGVLFIFDGLDEVPTDALRTYVRDCAAAFIERYPDAQMILTCRTIPYQNKQWQLEWVPVFELATFDSDQIDAFIAAWFAAHRDLCGMDATQAESKRKTLTDALHDEKRIEMRRLGGNPMMLTVMAILQTTGRTLPEKRAELYRGVVDLLLLRWDETRRDDGVITIGLSELMRDAGCDMNDLRTVLHTLALNAQHACLWKLDDAVADISRATLHKQFLDATEKTDASGKTARKRDPLTGKDDYGWANRVVETIQDRSGLLLAVQENVFQFPHRSFQEFMAAGALIADAEFPANIASLVDESGYWREVIKWVVGIVTHCDNRPRDAMDVIESLCPGEAEGDSLRWQKAWLAGECILEMGRSKADKLPNGSKRVARVIAELVALVEAGALPPRDRAAAGMVLGRLGDPRKGVGCKDGVPEFAWSPVFQKCDYVLGDNNEKRSILEDYQMSIYPVTVAQFAAFIDDGYRNDDYWTPEGRKWRKENPDPWEYDRAEFQTRNHPRVGVSWYEAVAFCKWASKRLGQSIRLPTEAEWERAAAGTKEGGRPAPLRREASPPKSQDAGNHSVVQGAETAPLLGATRDYAWGAAADADLPTHCNCEIAGIDQTSAVGIFPTGKTPEDIFDMTGNVYEWCASRYGDKTKDASLPVADLENISNWLADKAGVVRGGSWAIGNPVSLRASCRGIALPGTRGNDGGFRVLLVAVAR